MRLSSGPGRENGYPASSASEQPKNEDRARCVILDCRLARRGFDFAYAVRAFLDPDRITGRDRPTGGSFGNMSRTRIRIDPGNPRSLPAGRVDYGVLDGTTERDIALQQREDDDEAARDIARYAPRFANGWGSRNWSSRGASTFRKTRSATGNRENAARPALPGPCSRFSTRLPRLLCGCWAEAPALELHVC